MAATKYTIFINDTATDFARSTKATVVAEADRLRKAGERGAIEVRTGTGHVAYGLKEIKARNITKHTKPFTKTVELPADFAKLVPAGYVAAYTRPRNDAAVLRNEGADEDERYAVMRLSTGELVDFVATTRDAGQVMKGMKAVKATA